MSEPFILQPQTVLSQRALSVVWRRFRTLTRSGPKTELDVEGTIAERCRRGVLADPVLRRARVNRARLLVLADVSPSMAPWYPFLDTLKRSLDLSRLRQAGMFYFNNIPRRSVFRSVERTGGVSLRDLFAEYSGASLLIVSDAGAARGFLNHRRIGHTEEFLSETRRHHRATVWINPMPRPRWQGTTAAGLVQNKRRAVFLPLDIASVIRAVDILRGAKGG